MSKSYFETFGKELDCQDDSEIQRYLFNIGFTSMNYATISAGRGIGLMSAQELLAEIGGCMAVEFKRDAHRTKKGYIRCIFHISIPRSHNENP
jgi:3-deoxy-D-manno-octulosonic acid (KDO) 8-phosphate synthase